MKSIVILAFISILLIFISIVFVIFFKNKKNIKKSKINLFKNFELSKNFKFYSDAKLKSNQEAANKIIALYVEGLNTANTNLILTLFAEDGVALWNKFPSYLTQSQRRKGYDDLFKQAKFNAVFIIDKTEIYGNIATIRTHHKIGQTIKWNGKDTLDLDREIFVLRRDDGHYKIILYMFNNDKFQGQE
jgi:ketosteroid isomerase-like protein